MKCIKCNSEMKKADIETKIIIYGEIIKEPPFADYQKSYNPVYAFVCEKCGYIEFYTHADEEYGK